MWMVQEHNRLGLPKFAGSFTRPWSFTMSRMSRYMVSNGQRGQTLAVNRESSVSQGVDVCLQGWSPGLNKVQLTKAFREGGIGLNAASRLTGEVLKGHEVRAHFNQFDSPAAARAALERIGVERVWSPR
jgi:hypothetical protein